MLWLRKRALSWKEEYDPYRNRQYDKLAGELRKALNMELIYKVLGLEGRKE